METKVYRVTLTEIRKEDGKSYSAGRSYFLEQDSISSALSHVYNSLSSTDVKVTYVSVEEMGELRK